MFHNEFKPSCRGRFFFQLLRQTQISLRQTQTPVVQTQSARAGTYRAMLPNLLSTVTAHTRHHSPGRQLNNLEHETAQVSHFFYLLHLENRSRKLQIPTLTLLLYFL